MQIQAVTPCLAVLLIVGCVGPNTEAPLSRLRETDGACAADLLRGASISVETCLFVGAPGRIGDDGKTPFIRTELTATDPRIADPGNWKLEVLRDESPVQAEQLTHMTPGDRYCDAGRPCGKEATDVRPSHFPLAAGRYVFRYTCTLDGSLVATNRFTLY
jgi:hypothetical protein